MSHLNLGLSLSPWSVAVISPLAHQRASVISRKKKETDEALLVRALLQFFTENRLAGSIQLKLNLTIDQGAFGFHMGRAWPLRIFSKFIPSSGIQYGRVLKSLQRRALSYDVKVEGFDVHLIDPFLSLASSSPLLNEKSHHGVLMVFSQVKRPLSLWIAEREMHFVWSLGSEGDLEKFLEAMASFAGFKGRRSWKKFLALAELGESRYCAEVRSFIDESFEDGQFQLDLPLIEKALKLDPDFQLWEQIFRSKSRKPNAPITSRELDLAASLKLILNELLKKSARAIRQNTGTSNLTILGDSPLLPYFEKAFEDSGEFTELYMDREDQPISLARGAMVQGMRGDSLNLGT